VALQLREGMDEERRRREEPNGSAMTSVENCSPAASRENRLRLSRGSRRG
jgi:hypothetical protein